MIHTHLYAVATHGLSRQYGSKVALDQVELRVPNGAVYVLVGVNGAGKSTLFKLLMNLERPNAGTAAVFGLDTARQGPEVRAQVGYVPERQDAPYRSMTCARLLRHVSAFYPDWDHAYADHLARALGVHLERRVGGLSKGETRRLQLVLALGYRPPLLLLDEPTDGLDPVVRRRALALLAEHLADAPTTVLISTHHIHELESLADHVGVLRDGCLVAQMSREELQRTVRSYHLEVPAGWEAPRELQATGLRRSSAGRDLRCTFVGEEQEVSRRLIAAGASVRKVSTMALEDAALAFLPEDPS
ncbi:MAG: ABC-type multidrug transport system, ATPase component [Gemmatimonadetes bacterium]|nr:ABC-type multidrug transport system, ATPase component [Gemmatimonadota bacterium]